MPSSTLPISGTPRRPSWLWSRRRFSLVRAVAISTGAMRTVLPLVPRLPPRLVPCLIRCLPSVLCPACRRTTSPWQPQVMEVRRIRHHRCSTDYRSMVVTLMCLRARLDTVLPPYHRFALTQHWQPQPAGQQSRPQTPNFGSIRGPSPVQAQSSPYGYPQPGTSSMAPTQGYRAPYGRAQPTSSVPGGGNANQLQWRPTGTPGSMHQLGHFQCAMPQPQGAGSPGAYQLQSGSPPGAYQYQTASTGAYHLNSAAYSSGNTGVGHQPHGIAAQAPSTGYSPQGASYETSGYGNTVQPDTVQAPPAATNPLQTSTQPALKPQRGLPPRPVKTLEPLAHPGVRSATGVSQLSRLKPAKRVGQPLHQSRTSASITNYIASASSTGLSASSADTFPTSSSMEKPKRTQTKPSSTTNLVAKTNPSSSALVSRTNPSSTKAPAPSSKHSSTAPFATSNKPVASTTAEVITKPTPILVNKRSQSDLGVVALHANPTITTVSKLILTSAERRDTFPSPHPTPHISLLQI